MAVDTKLAKTTEATGVATEAVEAGDPTQGIRATAVVRTRISTSPHTMGVIGNINPGMTVQAGRTGETGTCEVMSLGEVGSEGHEELKGHTGGIEPSRDTNKPTQAKTDKRMDMLHGPSTGNPPAALSLDSLSALKSGRKTRAHSRDLAHGAPQ